MAVAAIAAGGVLATPAFAATVKEQLAGTWGATLVGYTACGPTTMYAVFTLDTTGQTLAGSFRIQTHSSGCADSISYSGEVYIRDVSTGNEGLGYLAGPNGVWNVKIQVDSGLRLFSMVDVSDPNSFVQGVAIRQD